jgi:hypothetical protein
MDLQVLEYDIPLIGDEQDPVIRYRFFAIDCPDVHVIWLQADVRASSAGAVAGSAPVNKPDLDFADLIAVIVPVLLQEFMAGQHNPSQTGKCGVSFMAVYSLSPFSPFVFYGRFTKAGFFLRPFFPKNRFFREGGHLLH